MRHFSVSHARRLLAILLAVCLTAVGLSPAGVAAGEVGTTHTVAKNGDPEALINSAQVQDGDTIHIEETAGFRHEGDSPWVISKRVTIEGGNINIGAGGIVLGADVTFKDVTLTFQMSARNAILANGHVLTLENVKCGEFSFNLFCGGWIDSNHEGYPNPAPGTRGEIVIKGATSLQNRDTYGNGNIYAGNLCMGGTDQATSGVNGPANAFAGDAVIRIDSGASSAKLGQIYACGAQQKNPDGQTSGKITLPDAANYTVSGTVTIQGNVPHTVDGAGAAQTVVIFESGNSLPSYQIRDVSQLTVQAGSLALESGSSAGSLAVAGKAKLDITKLDAPEIDRFDGGGLLVLGETQTLKVSGGVSGETKVAIGGANNTGTETSKLPQVGHTYIMAPGAAGASFQLLPYGLSTSRQLVWDGQGNWVGSEGASDGDMNRISSFCFLTKSASADVNQEAEFHLEATLGNGNYQPLDYIPLTVYIGSVQLQAAESEDGYYTYTDALHKFSAYVQDNTFSVTTAEEGTHTIQIIVSENTVGGAPLSDTATLTVGDASQPQPEHTHVWSADWSGDTGFHWRECTAEECPITANQQKAGYAAHTAGEWIIDRPATADGEGSRYKACSACGYEMERETIPATGAPRPEHTHEGGADWSGDTGFHWRECTAEECPITANQQKAGYAAHTAGEWIIDRPATADGEGSRHKACTVCGYEMERETIPATGGETPEPGPAPAPGHTHRWSTTWEGDQNGHWYVCLAAGCPITIDSQKAGYAAHTLGPWVVDRVATMFQAGSRYRACTVCGREMERETVHAAGGGLPGTPGGSFPAPGTPSAPVSGSSANTPAQKPGSSQTEGQAETAVTTETAADGSTTQMVQKPDGSREIRVRRPDGVTALVHVDTAGRIQAEVTLPSGVESTSLPIPEMPVGRESASTVTVHTGSTQPVQVVIPAVSAASGVVAILVQADGTQTVLKTSTAVEGGIAASVPDGAVVGLVDNSAVFSDTQDHWAADAIDFVSARELFSGGPGGTFRPEEPMSRAMLMTVLARLDGVDTGGGALWYEKGMAWAVARGVSDGKNPDGQITREQMVTMLYRCAGSPAVSDGALSFRDAGAVSGYAREAVRWGVENGIISGYGDGTFAPGGQTTRAQAATMLMQYITFLNQS